MIVVLESTDPIEKKLLHQSWIEPVPLAGKASVITTSPSIVSIYGTAVLGQCLGSFDTAWLIFHHHTMSPRTYGKCALRVTDVQAKVIKATSNDPGGPSGARMNEIAQMTYNMCVRSSPRESRVLFC